MPDTINEAMKKPSRGVRIGRVLIPIFALLVVILIVFFIMKFISSNQATQMVQPSAPTYETVLPKNKTITQLGGWQNISPPGQEAVFAYADRIKSIDINVSQQVLPEDFAGDTEAKVAELAKKFNATTKKQIDGVSVYSGVSAKGPQSIIFTRDDLLIFIKSEQKLDTKSLTSYIKSLH